MREQLEQYPDVTFIDGLMFDDFLEELIMNYKKKYKEITGKEVNLAPASTERLIIYSCASLMYQSLQYIDRSGKMGLLKYSTDEFLDNIAALKKVKRNPSIPATTQLKFTLSKVQTFPIAIPIQTRAKVDNLFYATTKSGEILPGEDNIIVPAVCLTEGEVGNGYEPGAINTIVDPINYVASVENISKTSGGADRESDDSLAERVYLAPSGYSVAGPEEAYLYWIKTYSQAIKDCYITSESPGEVDIYVILQDGEIPGEEQLNNIYNFLNEGDKKPLTDQVKVKAPEINEYDIDVVYYISETDKENEDTIKKQIEMACKEFEKWQQEVIGRDINPSRLMYMLIAAGACHAVVKQPEWREITSASISKAKNVKMEYGGLKDARYL